jgi:hypothetical protein
MQLSTLLKSPTAVIWFISPGNQQLAIRCQQPISLGTLMTSSACLPVITYNRHNFERVLGLATATQQPTELSWCLLWVLNDYNIIALCPSSGFKSKTVDHNINEHRHHQQLTESGFKQARFYGKAFGPKYQKKRGASKAIHMQATLHSHL